MAQYSIYDIIALLVSIMLPPLGVVMKRGWLPGLFHAFYVIFKYRDESNSGEGRPIFGGTRPETQHSYPKDKGSVVKDAQKSGAGFSNEEVSQAYPPTYGNHGKDEKLEGQSNAYYTDSDDKKRHQ
ncbi:13385_t:CDS:2 [Funneliformis caledonium]|uniref:13385_t:CDS:1 n=1 Tax=Funneliformis caledonium TaxID=1117310 RepID=A0A9N9H6Q9_9GLOM|nr:13385_t:CDS:2 [Funneliformis caledonium]